MTTTSPATGPTSFLARTRHFSPEHTLHLKEYGHVHLRPIRPEDEAALVRFHETLPEESVYLRFFEHISLDTRTLPERLARVCANTAESFAVVAEKAGHRGDPAAILAVGRLTVTDVAGATDFALLMGPEAWRTELPHDLLVHLIGLARAHGFQLLTGELLNADHGALALCRRFGFTLQTATGDTTVRVSYPL